MKSSKLFGLHSVQAAIDYSLSKIIRVWIDAQRLDKRLGAIIGDLAALGIEPEKTDKKKFDRLADGNNHQGIAMKIEMPDEQSESDLKTMVENPTTSAGGCSVMNKLQVFNITITQPHRPVSIGANNFQ